MSDWVPVDICGLPSAEQPLRTKEFDDLFREHLVGVERVPGRAVLTLRGGADLDATVHDLARRESACCSFFRFEVAVEGDVVRLTVEVPTERQDVLDALVRRAL